MEMVFYGLITINSIVFIISERRNINPSHIIISFTLFYSKQINIYYFTSHVTLLIATSLTKLFLLFS
jgi:hypothetical protein